MARAWAFLPAQLYFEMDYGNPAPPSQYLESQQLCRHRPRSIGRHAITPADTDWLQLVAPRVWHHTGYRWKCPCLADNIQAGTHTGSIVIDGGAQTANSPFTVPVTLAVLAPSMSVSPNTYSIVSQPNAVIPQKIVQCNTSGWRNGSHQLGSHDYLQGSVGCAEGARRCRRG